jgi:hypothetical protein
MPISLLAPLLVLLAADAGAPPSHATWDQLLSRYASEQGVDYESWRASADDHEQLRLYLASLKRADNGKWPRSAQLAYWINLYNAATVQLVLEHPEAKSIKDIGGPDNSPWKRIVIRIAGRDLTLDDIEHEMLRFRFGDARVHFALNCAARSCPPLLPSAFLAENLEAQLDSVTRTTVNDPRFVDASRISAHGGVLRLNSIFQWYAGDFGDLIPFFDRYRDEGLPSEFEVEYMDYDWQLNAAPKVD